MDDATMPPADSGTAPPPPPRLRADLRGLRRSRSDRVVAGVLGGLGRRLGVDPLVLRIATVVLAVFGGIGIMLYAAGWLLLPTEDEDASVAEQALGRHDTGSPRTATIALAAALALVLLGSAAAVIGGSWDGVVLLVLAGCGIWLLLRRDDPRVGADRVDDAPPDAPGAFMDYPGYPGYPGYQSSSAAVTAPAEVPETAGRQSEGPATEGPADEGQADVGHAHMGPGTDVPGADVSDQALDSPTPEAPVPPERWWAEQPDLDDDPQTWATHNEDWDPFAAGEPLPTPATEPPPHRSALGPLTVSAAAVTVGAMAVADAVGASILPATYVAAALGVVGLGLLLGAWWGRSRGLIVLGVLLALALVPAVVVDRADLRGERFSIAPTTLSAIPTGTQDHGVGSVRYDLSQVAFADGESASLAIDQGVGELLVIVPPDVDVDVNADLGVGEIRTFEGESGGMGQERRITDLGTDGRGGGDLRLDLDLGIGSIEVRREAP
ncbi:MAG TPA: PspC domain-containing protein [Jiangellaceae bacterium]|nr:PspC domain-containing protein [Jiangellaceae bacterium]